MFGIPRKIGTGATSRRRPARKCEMGIECLDSRTVPAIIVPTPGSPLLESGLGTLGSNVLNVAFDEHGHASAQITTINPFTGQTSTTSRLLATNLNAAGVPQPIPGVDFGTTTTPGSTNTVLVFGQVGSANTITATNPTPSSTRIQGTDVPISITNIAIPNNPGTAFLNLTANSVNAASGVGSNFTQRFSGQFSITSGTGGTGTNFLSGQFTDAIFGSGGSLTLSSSDSGSETLTFTSGPGGVPAADLMSPTALSFGFTNVTPLVTGIPNGTIPAFDSNIAGNFSASTPPMTTTVPTLAYKLPTPVADGDVAVYNFQTGQLSDLLRFQTVSDPVAGTTSWLLVYSDVSATNPADSPADVGVPTPTHSVLTQSAIEFGVEGYSVIEYAAEQATYSGLSDGNGVFFGAP